MIVGVLLLAASLALFGYFWPRAGQPRIWHRSALLRDMAPLAAVSGFALGITMILSAFRP